MNFPTLNTYRLKALALQKNSDSFMTDLCRAPPKSLHVVFGGLYLIKLDWFGLDLLNNSSQIVTLQLQGHVHM